MLGLSKDVSKVYFGPGASKLQDSKVGGQKKGSRLCFFAILLLQTWSSGNPGSIPGRCKL